MPTEHYYLTAMGEADYAVKASLHNLQWNHERYNVILITTCAHVYPAVSSIILFFSF